MSEENGAFLIYFYFDCNRVMCLQPRLYVHVHKLSRLFGFPSLGKSTGDNHLSDVLTGHQSLVLNTECFTKDPFVACPFDGFTSTSSSSVGFEQHLQHLVRRPQIDSSIGFNDRQ